MYTKALIEIDSFLCEYFCHISTEAVVTYGANPKERIFLDSWVSDNKKYSSFLKLTFLN